MGELGGTMIEPSAVVKGEKVKSAPPLRSRETHSQSVAMMSTEPPCRPTVLARGVTSSSIPSALSRPLARMVSSTQLTVPNLSTPTLTLVEAWLAGAPVTEARARTSKTNRHDRNGRSSTLVFSVPMALGLTRRDGAEHSCRRGGRRRSRPSGEARKIYGASLASGGAYSTDPASLSKVPVPRLPEPRQFFWENFLAFVQKVHAGEAFRR